MTIRSRKNPFAGINPILEYLLPMPHDPSPSVFPSFHSDHITNITEALNRQLPDHYIARTEQSLQIRTDDFLKSDYLLKQPEPDSTIYKTIEGDKVTLAVATVPTWKLEIDMLALEKMFPSVAIYEVEPHQLLGKPVTRIELLSPSNKLGGSGHKGYMSNRFFALNSGTNLIELDYLHQAPPPVTEILPLPVYPTEADTHPYTIAISKPLKKKMAVQVYGFAVDSPIPTVNIPLLNDEILPFEFNAVYQHTFEMGRWGTYLDYAQPLPPDLLPDLLPSFSPADQERITARLHAILTEAPP